MSSVSELYQSVILDLIDAPYTFLNERLAKHYGIPYVYGSRFRRVTLGEDSVRGGLLGQGSILTVTSYANRTSPVLRGKWILENLLAAPPPDPPAGTPRLDESKIAIRAGHHCAQPLMRRFGVPATARASFSVYNTHEDVEALGRGIERAQALFA